MVIVGADVIPHMRRLRVVADIRIGIGGARVGHVAQSPPLEIRPENAGADQPVGLIRGLVQGPLLYERAEHIRHGFVQRAGLILIAELGRKLRDAVRQLMGDDFDRAGEIAENLSVAIAVDHLLAVPKGIVVILAIMNGGQQCAAVAVDGFTSKNLIEELPRGACIVECLVDDFIGADRIAFHPRGIAR